MLELLKKQLDVNEASRTDVATQEAALRSSNSKCKPYEAVAATATSWSLSWAFPGEGLPEKFEFSCFQLPHDLPLSLPSKIVRNRPDIRAAEANITQRQQISA